MAFERRIGLFTGPAAQAFELANQAAKQMRPDRVEVGHLLLGLVQAENSIAQDVLLELGVDEQRIAEFIEQTVHVDELKPGTRPIESLSFTTVFNLAGQEAHIELKQVNQAINFVIADAHYDLAPGMKRALEVARARILDEYTIGTEHLLLGMARRSEKITEDVLAFLNISLDELRERIHQARINRGRVAGSRR